MTGPKGVKQNLLYAHLLDSRIKVIITDFEELLFLYNTEYKNM